MKKIIITGNVGRDAELKASQSGEEFVIFSVGVSVGTKQNPKTDWVDVTCNGKLSDLARNYIKKGTKVLVEGFPSVNAYINRENKPIGTLRVYANNIELLGGNKQEENENNYTLPEVNNIANINTISNDDIPF